MNCEACGSTRFKPWRSEGEWRVIECRVCHLRMTWPRPTAATLAAVYGAGDYYDARGMGATAKVAWEARARGILDRVPTPVETALDIGAGQGHFANALRALGIRVAGVEPTASGRLAAARYGLEFVSALEELPAGTFDIVTLLHSLEHMENPLEVLRAVSLRMTPSSWLFIEVPHAGSVEMLRPAVCREILDLPAHLFHFVPKSLTRLVERAGLCVREVFFSNPDFLEEALAFRARRAGPSEEIQTGQPAAFAPVAGAQGISMRRLVSQKALPWLRRTLPGRKFQLLASR